MSLINWPTVCLPKIWDSLGIVDLELRNVALLLRWWWKLYNDSDSLWTIVIIRIRKKGTCVNVEKYDLGSRISD